MTNFLSTSKKEVKTEQLHPPTRYIITTPDEVVAIAFRAEDELAENSARGVDWLDTQRHLLLEYSEEDKHTIPLTGTSVLYLS